MTAKRLLIGSLCSGYEGLGLGVQSVLGGELAWVADNDPAASAILAHRFPHAPNLGDIRTADWPAAEPVDILTAGFPCQPVSLAGRRRGLADERWLWDDIREAIGRMVTPPRLLLLENVYGLLSAYGGHAMAGVVEGLAALGYVGCYGLFRASDAGAPHRRERVFILATLADTDGATRDQWRLTASEQAQGGRSRADARRRGGMVATEPGGARLALGSIQPDRHERPAAIGGRRDDVATHARGERRERGAGSGRGGRQEALGQQARGNDSDRGRSPAEWWGPYAPAIARWEDVTGRAAPRPAEPARAGKPRLSPRFVEWLMGLPSGHVTEVPGLGRKAQLRALGNGVVPQQAALALRMLLADGIRGVDSAGIVRGHGALAGSGPA